MENAEQKFCMMTRLEYLFKLRKNAHRQAFTELLQAGLLFEPVRA